ncbi:MAG: type III secretion system chaperone [Mailhella sp.]|nr:type III secretion system chaperone [Mailhella sp.]
MPDIREYFAALGDAAGTLLEPDAAGAVMMTMQGRPCMLRHVEGEDRFLFYAELGRPCGFGTEDLYRRLLSANFLMAETFGGSLGLDPAGAAGISFFIPASGDTGRFASDVHAAALAAGEWAARFASLNAFEEGEAAARQDAPAADPGEEYAAFGPSDLPPELMGNISFV